jgi:hypothetical protein
MSSKPALQGRVHAIISTEAALKGRLESELTTVKRFESNEFARFIAVSYVRVIAGLGRGAVMIFNRPLRSELQARLDAAKVLEKLKSLDSAHADEAGGITPPQNEFFMSGLFGLIPGSDTAPIRIDTPEGKNRCH